MPPPASSLAAGAPPAPPPITHPATPPVRPPALSPPPPNRAPGARADHARVHPHGPLARDLLAAHDPLLARVHEALGGERGVPSGRADAVHGRPSLARSSRPRLRLASAS